MTLYNPLKVDEQKRRMVIVDIFNVIKTVLSALAFVFFILSIVFLILGVSKRKGGYFAAMVVSFILAGACVFIQFPISVQQYYGVKIDDLPSFTVRSDDLEGGIWATRISHDAGEDISPQLSWDPVEGAAGYAVYMIDPDGGDWLHMKCSTTETALAAGQIGAPAESGSEGYKGPYPPATHTYIVYVFALRDMRTVPGTVDTPGDSVNELFSMVNTDPAGNAGNVLACGILSGEYPAN